MTEYKTILNLAFAFLRTSPINKCHSLVSSPLDLIPCSLVNSPLGDCFVDRPVAIVIDWC